MSEPKGFTPEERADLLRMLRYGATIVGAVAVMIVVWAVLANVFNFQVGEGRGVAPTPSVEVAPEATAEATPNS